MAPPSASHLAAILPSPKAPLEIHSIPTPTPAPGELLIKTSFIALNGIEAKIALLAPFPVLYPAILGFSFSGTIHAVGSNDTTWTVGEKVLTSKRFGTQENAYSAYQRYVLVPAGEKVVARIPGAANEEALVGMLMNAVSVPGLFSGRLGLRWPGQSSVVEDDKKEGKKILVYGGTSSMGRLSVQYLSQAGYTVITTSSPSRTQEIRELGAQHVLDHTLAPTSLTSALEAEGPYSIIVDMISSPQTIGITAQVLASQGGGKLYAMQPAFSPEKLPEGVERWFEPWPESLYEQGNEALLQWVVEEYLPHGIEKGWVSEQPWEKVEGGLKGIGSVLERVLTGNGGKRMVVDAWE